MISDIMSRMIAWIISWMFWFERFCCCCLVISTSLDEKEFMKCDDSLWFVKVFEWRFLSFCNMTSDISFRALSDNEIFSNDSVKLWKDSAKFWKDSAKFFFERADDWNEISTWIDISFFLFFLKKCLVDFFEIFLSNLNDTLINFLNDLLFLKRVFDVIDLVNWDVLDIFEISINDMFFSAENDLSSSLTLRWSFNHSA
jgi:hypothetical protein